MLPRDGDASLHPLIPTLAVLAAATAVPASAASHPTGWLTADGYPGLSLAFLSTIGGVTEATSCGQVILAGALAGAPLADRRSACLRAEGAFRGPPSYTLRLTARGVDLAGALVGVELRPGPCLDRGQPNPSTTTGAVGLAGSVDGVGVILIGAAGGTGPIAC